MSSTVVKCSSCNIVINEVLAFICNKIDVMNEDSISQICVSAFTDEEITMAKNLLFESIPTSRRNIKRKRHGKTRRDIDDIICLLKVSEPDEIPVFVARELHKLPPVLFDHVDATKLLRDLLTIQEEIKQVRNQYATLEQLDGIKSELTSVKAELQIIKRSPVPSSLQFVNNRRGACLMNSYTHDSGPMGLQHIPDNRTAYMSGLICSTPEGTKERNTQISSIVSRAENDKLETVSHNCTATEGETGCLERASYGDRVTSPSLCVISAPETAVLHTVDMDVANEYGKLSMTSTPLSQQRSTTQTVKGGRGCSRIPNYEEKTVFYRNKKHNFTGFKGKAAVEHHDKFKAVDVKIPIHIYNVAKDVTSMDINEYIFKKSGIQAEIKEIKMKITKTYNSYKIMIPEHSIDIFMNDEFWPMGISYRKFLDFKHFNKKGEGRKQYR